MKVYKGFRGENGAQVVIKQDGIEMHLRERWDLRNHSPDGFEWGYGGSGPAQLALAICADATRDDAVAQQVYQDFKFRVVSSLDHEGFLLTEHYVKTIIDEILMERARKIDEEERQREKDDNGQFGVGA